MLKIRRRFGLLPKVKAGKVANYVLGVSEPRLIRRNHVRILQASGRSISVDKLHPWPELMTD